MQQKEIMKELVLTGLFVAIIFIMALTPLGYIPLGVIRATIIQIPVIIGALFCGYKKGAFLGFVFGFTSCLTGTITPTLTSFLFSPIIAATQIGPMGAAYSTLICFVPRIATGVFPVFLYRRLGGICKSANVRLSIAGAAGSLTNTILVMSGIVLFYREAYAQVMGVSAYAVLGLIATTICINGVIEAILSACIVSAVGNVLIRIKPIR